MAITNLNIGNTWLFTKTISDRETEPRTPFFRFDLIAISPIVLRELNVVEKYKGVTVGNEVEIPPPGQVIGLKHNDPIIGSSCHHFFDTRGEVGDVELAKLPTALTERHALLISASGEGRVETQARTVVRLTSETTKPFVVFERSAPRVPCQPHSEMSG